MTTEKNGGGAGYHPGTTPAAQKIAAAAKRPDSSCQQGNAPDRLPVVSAVAVPPLGRRSLWLLWVPQCSFCGYGHAHRAGSATGGVRAAGCGLGDYHLRVVRAQGRGVAA